MSGPLSGIRVIDMTRVVAGPLAAQTFADLGAEVIKIERRGEGDDVRRVGPPWLPGGEGANSTYFQSVNRGKRSLTLDFTKPDGIALLLRLIDGADVLIENYRTGTLAQYGLGYDDLHRRKPGLIYCSITGFGLTGPYSNRSGYDYLAQAMGGLMDVTGHADGQPGAGPLRVGVPVADIAAGMNAVIGVLAALRHRDATGQGQQIDISLLDSQIAMMLNPVAAWCNAGAAIPRTGNDHPSASPYGVYPVADGHILVATFNDREFARLAAELGHAEWATDPLYATNGARVANRPSLAKAITDILLQHTKDYWVTKLNAAKISCGPINTMADLVRDPHVQARGAIVTLDHPVHGPIRVPRSPIRLSACPAEQERAPPTIGQHTDEVLGELGLDAAAIADLRQRGIV